MTTHMKTWILTLLIVILTSFFATSTVEAQENTCQARKIEGVPCEIGVSEVTVSQWQKDVAEARKEARQERAESNQLVGKLEVTNAEVNRLDVIRIELERQNATLEDEIERRATREKWAWGIAATSTAATVVLLIFATSL